MAKGKKQKKVTILWGLPGSGKTLYATTQSESDRYNSDLPHVVNVDNIGRYVDKHCNGRPEEVSRQLGIDATGNLNNRNWVIVDGLVTTNAVAKRYMDAIKASCDGGNYDILFDILVFNPDREACKFNDQGRRKLSSTFTIENLPFEEPDEAYLKGDWRLKVTRKSVVKKPMHRVWAKNVGQGDNDVLESDTWSLGSSGSSDTPGTTGEKPPLNFDAFDKMLEQVCPAITYLQYKKVYRECVSIRESYESDYYSGTTTYARYVCDLKKLYAMLVETGVVQ